MSHHHLPEGGGPIPIGEVLFNPHKMGSNFRILRGPDSRFWRLHVAAMLAATVGVCAFRPCHVVGFSSEQRQGRPYRTHSELYLSSVSDPLETPVPQARRQLRKKKLKTFSRFLEVEMWKHNELRGLEPVLQAVSEACKQITRIVQRANTDDIYGAALGPDGNPLDGTNVQGEVQQKLDVLCNTILLRAFCGSSSNIACVASEEEDEPRCCSDVMVRV
jgi:Fructose-1-6-bisphosphatase, N-terminal domain